MRYALYFLAFVAACSPLQEPSHETPWPDLPTTGVFSGRAATVQDVGDGRAFFAQDSGAVALGIPLPQYATLKTAGGERVRGFVLQAEQRNGRGLAAFQPATGGRLEVLSMAALTLHGQERPEQGFSHPLRSGPEP